MVDSALKMSSEDDNRLEVIDTVVGVATSGSRLMSANGTSLWPMVIIWPLIRLLLIRIARVSGLGVGCCIEWGAFADTGGAPVCGTPAVGLWCTSALMAVC